MAERSNAAVLKTVIPGDRDRGFESHSLLQPSPHQRCYCVMPRRSKAEHNEGRINFGDHMNVKRFLLAHYDKYMFFMGFAGQFIFVFQIKKILITRCSTDVSLEGFLISSLATASWLLYGLLRSDKVLIGVNLFGTIAGIICLIVIIMFR